MTKRRHIPGYEVAAIAALTCLWSVASHADAASLDRVLEGADGDRVTILLATGERDDASTVTLCLFDGTADDIARAFDIRTTATPRFWTSGDETPACGRVSDTAHSVSFFALMATDGVREILRTRLDLGGLSGRRVNLIWTAKGL